MFRGDVVKGAVTIGGPFEIGVVVDVAFGSKGGIGTHLGIVAGIEYHLGKGREAQSVNHDGILAIAARLVFFEGEPNYIQSFLQCVF